jgi:phosphoribosylglycinamide formyltransferase-1
MRPNIIVFASGSAQGGGSGFENLVIHSRDKHGDLDAKIVAVVSNHAAGGVFERAKRLDVPFVHFPAPWTAERYAQIVAASGAEWVALSGWLKFVCGLDPQKTFNIHPALLSFQQGRFGGQGMFGHYVHEAVAAALVRGEINESGFSMHFVSDDDEYDKGPICWEHKVPLFAGMNADTIGKLVNEAEHRWQPLITNALVHGEISWDGKNRSSLKVSNRFRLIAA